MVLPVHTTLVVTGTEALASIQPEMKLTVFVGARPLSAAYKPVMCGAANEVPSSKVVAVVVLLGADERTPIPPPPPGASQNCSPGKALGFARFA